MVATGNFLIIFGMLLLFGGFILVEALFALLARKRPFLLWLPAIISAALALIFLVAMLASYLPQAAVFGFCAVVFALGAVGCFLLGLLFRYLQTH